MSTSPSLPMRVRVRPWLFWLMLPGSLLLTAWLQGGWLGLLVNQGDVTVQGRVTAQVASWCRGPFRRFTPAQELRLKGDLQRPDAVAAQRAIWEAWPDHPAYFHNYLSHLVFAYAGLGTTPAARFAIFAAEVEKGRSLDPDNARLDYLLAATLLEQAVALKRPVPYWWPRRAANDTLVITDPDKLAAAMAWLQRGLAKPHFRRYVRELQEERLAIWGMPSSFDDMLEHAQRQQQSVFPDWEYLPVLAEAAATYGHQLAGQGQLAAAEPFLQAWQGLANQLNADSFMLVDTLVVFRICGAARNRVPAVYQNAGLPDRGREAAAAMDRAMAPTLALWRRVADRQFTLRHRPEDEGAKYYDFMLAHQLQDYGEPVVPADLAPLRFLDYVVSARLVLAFLCFALAFAALPLLVFSRLVLWRFRPAADATVRVWLRTRDLARILLLAGLLPCVVFAAAGCLFPGSGWDLGLRYNSPRYLLQGVALVLAVFLLAARLTRRQVLELYRAGGLPTPVAPREFFWPFMIGVLALLCGLGFLLPQDWLNGGVWWVPPAVLTLLSAIALGATLMLRWDRRFGNTSREPELAFDRSWPFSLAQVFAVLLLFFNLVLHPLLRLEEKQLLARDTIERVQPAWGGLSGLEARTVQRLKAEYDRAAAPVSPR